MKRVFEIFLVIFVILILIYSLFYIFYFDKKCNGYSGINNTNIKAGYIIMANCQDSLICELGDVETDNRNIPSNWTCTKKESPIFKLDFFKSIGENFINSIIN